MSYGEPAGLPTLFRILVTFVTVNLLPNGKSFKLCGTSFYFVADTGIERNGSTSSTGDRLQVVLINF